jgi:hypothetical protein
MALSTTTRAGAAGALAALAALPSAAAAHGIAGDRFFPATLTVDDPAVADELSLPTVSHLEGEARQTDVSAEYSKRLTRTFGLSLGETWSRLAAPGEPARSGFQNLETAAKWQALTSAPHEAIVSLGLSAEWSGTGARGVGAERHTTVTPTLYFGKGLGDLPPGLGWARPFAVTGAVGYALPSRGRDPGEDADNPRVMEWGLTLQYSLPYLQAQVKDLGLPAPLDGLTPIVEASLETPLTGPDRTTTGTVNPGLIWAGRRFQLGAEAMIPVNGASGRHVGAVLQLHLYLDDLLARSLGKPIW